MMERYKEYKDSGVKWLGEIPSHWEVLSFRHIIKTLTDFTANGSFGDLAANVKYLDRKDFARLVRLTDLRNNFDEEKGVWVNKSSYEYLVKSELHGGELLIANVGAYSGLPWIMPKVTFRTTLAPNMFMLKLQDVITEYIYYLLSSSMYFTHLQMVASATAQPKLNKNNIREIIVLLPPLSEQGAIVRYLDSATSEIDKAIAMQQKMIDLLNERKQIIIQNAVTKGLDENVEMKESGVEWIGRIPKHWEVVPLKYTGAFGNGLTYSPNEIVDDGVLVIRSSNIQNSKLVFYDNVFVEITPQNLMVKKGDIIICSRNGSADLVGKCAIVEENINATFGAFMMRYTPNINQKYAFFLFQTAIRSYKGYFSTSTINQLTKTIIGEMKVPVAGISEQQQIAAYLDSEMQKFDSAITNCQRQITLLQERKQIIINEVVTGKVRVS